MITAMQAREIAEREMRSKPFDVPDDELILLGDKTIERAWGWVFFYSSRRSVKADDISHKVAGNAPFIVTRDGGDVHPTGTAHPIEHYIREFESRLE